MQALREAQRQLTQKATFVSGIAISLIGLIVTALVSTHESTPWPFWEKAILLTYCLSLIMVLLVLIRYLLPVSGDTVGTQPKDLFKKELMDHEFEEVAVWRLQLYQDSINDNRQRIPQFVVALKISYCLLVGYPVAVAVLYSLCLLCTIFRPHIS